MRFKKQIPFTEMGYYKPFVYAGKRPVKHIYVKIPFDYNTEDPDDQPHDLFINSRNQYDDLVLDLITNRVEYEPDPEFHKVIPIRFQVKDIKNVSS
jgi:hypothetical protein